MKPIRLPAQTPEQLAALADLYRTTKDVRLRQRAQLILLAAEKAMVAAEIASIVRLSEESVRRWLKRYQAEDLEGLSDEPRPGPPGLVTEPYIIQLVSSVRQRPRSLNLPFSLWTCHAWPTIWRKKQDCE